MALTVKHTRGLCDESLDNVSSAAILTLVSLCTSSEMTTSSSTCSEMRSLPSACKVTIFSPTTSLLISLLLGWDESNNRQQFHSDLHSSSSDDFSVVHVMAESCGSSAKYALYISEAWARIALVGCVRRMVARCIRSSAWHSARSLMAVSITVMSRPIWPSLSCISATNGQT